MASVIKSRIEKKIIRTLSELYLKELENPNIGFITFTRCELTKDFSLAKVYVSFLEYADGAEGIEFSFTILKKSAKFFRKRLSSVLRMKVTPEIFFILDSDINKYSDIKI